MTAGGKGSAPRPKSVDAETFASNWDAIFGKNKVPLRSVTEEVEAYDQYIAKHVDKEDESVESEEQAEDKE